MGKGQGGQEESQGQVSYERDGIRAGARGSQGKGATKAVGKGERGEQRGQGEGKIFRGEGSAG